MALCFVDFPAKINPGQNLNLFTLLFFHFFLLLIISKKLVLLLFDRRRSLFLNKKNEHFSHPCQMKLKMQNNMKRSEQNKKKTK